MLTIILSIFSLISFLRKLLEQREEELQQQVRSLRLSEASMTRTNAELSHRAQQLDTRLTILGAELSKAREEVRNSSSISSSDGIDTVGFWTLEVLFALLIYPFHIFF